MKSFCKKYLSRKPSTRDGVVLGAACTPMAPLDPTGAFQVPNARSSLMLLYDAVTQALASIQSQRWIKACSHILLHNKRIQQLQSWPIFLLLVPLLLSILSQRFAMVPPPCLTGWIGSEEDASFRLARRDHRRRRRSSQSDHLARFPLGRPKHQKVRGLKEVAAARVIQRWVRTRFQPWVAARSGHVLRRASPVEQWRDQYAGALVVTLVDDPASVWTVEQSREPSFVDVDFGTAVDDVDATSSHASPRCRGASTISSTRLFPSRNHADGFSA